MAPIKISRIKNEIKVYVVWIINGQLFISFPKNPIPSVFPLAYIKCFIGCCVYMYVSVLMAHHQIVSVNVETQTNLCCDGISTTWPIRHSE